MEFNEKLQQLRKQRQLTQEELASALYVSRTAVSKWESGRGYPGIDSLKAISAYFSVSIDELLSGGEVLELAEENCKRSESHFRDLLFGSLDSLAVIFFFLPLFGQRVDGSVQSVSLTALTGNELYLKVLYFVLVSMIAVLGVLTLALQSCQKSSWVRSKYKSSLILNVLAVLLFTVSLQPYAATILFAFLIVKVFAFTKWH